MTGTHHCEPLSPSLRAKRSNPSRHSSLKLRAMDGLGSAIGDSFGKSPCAKRHGRSSFGPLASADLLLERRSGYKSGLIKKFRGKDEFSSFVFAASSRPLSVAASTGDGAAHADARGSIELRAAGVE